MKHRTYALTDHDVEVISCAITALPSLGLEDSCPDLYQRCVSTGSKLITHQPLDPQDYGIIHTALSAVREICQGQFSYVDLDIKERCNEIFFDAGRLLSILGTPQ